MKKVLSLSAIALASLSLAACGKTVDHAAAKKAYVASTVQLSKDSSDYNAAKMSIKISDLQIEGGSSSDAKDAKKALDGAAVDVSTVTDKANKALSFSADAKNSEGSYKLSGYIADKGLYVASKDLKDILGANASKIPSGNMINSFATGLKTDYFALDANYADTILSQSGADMTWSKTIDQAFNADKSLTTDKVNQSLKDFPESDFTQSGSKSTMTYKGTGDDLDKVLKNLTANANVPADQINNLISEMKKDIDIKSIDVTSNVDEKNHANDAVVAIKAQSKSDKKETVSLKVNVDNQLSKSSDKVTLPSDKDTTTLEQLMSSLMSGFGSDGTDSTGL